MSPLVSKAPPRAPRPRRKVSPAIAQPAPGLPAPAGIQPRRILWAYAISIALIHLLCLLACVPWLFSWTGVALALSGHYVFGLLGMTLGYHRLLAHRGFSCPKWFEYLLAMLGVCCLQYSPAHWVAVHRRHHQHSDERSDPHSPLVAFFWGHVGWLLVRNAEISNFGFYDRYARDLLREPFYRALERRGMWLWAYLAHAALFFLSGLALAWMATGSYASGVQFGASLLVWGVLVRTVLVWHVTWSVNSLTHIWGYRTYETDDNSRNNWLVGLVAHGEGWHNNHHADQVSAAHGHKRWEIDLTWLVIRLFESLGLVTDVVRPRTGR